MPVDAMTVDSLRDAVADGSIDTVVLAVTDLQGRLQGKRLDAEYFLSDVLEHGTDGCNYLFAVDVEMNTVSGYSISSWDRGYGDFVMVPDLATLRRLSWQPGTVLLLADACWLDHKPVSESPSAGRLGGPFPSSTGPSLRATPRTNRDRACGASRPRIRMAAA